MTVCKDARFSVLLVRVLLSEIRRRGLSERVLLEDTEVDEALLSDPRGTITVLTWAALIERAIQLTGDPALGLSIAEHWSHTKLELLGHLFGSCRTLRESYRMFDRYKPLLGNSIRWVLEERGDRSYFFFDPVINHPVITPVAFEAWMGAVTCFARGFLCVGGEDSEVWFRHQRPAYHAQYARVFEGTLRFGQPRYALVGPREYLDREQLLGDATTQAAFQRGADRLLAGISAGSAVERARAVLWFERDLQAVSAANTAKRLGLSERELRRRISAERHSLPKLLDEARLRIAREALGRPGISIKEAAYALGYSESSAFFRAFKRWSGQTPLAYMRQLSDPSSAVAG